MKEERKALIVGLNNYPSAPLYGCINDAKKINDLLQKNGDGSPNFSTILITDERNQINKGELNRYIKKLFDGENNIVLLFYSGHGLITSTGGIIVTPDYKPHDEGISMNEILSIANKSKAKDKIVILDCCFSGNFGISNYSNNNMSQLSNGLTVLTACRESETASESNCSGIFSGLLIGALEGEAADIRGYITPGSIYSYVDMALGPWDQRPIFKTNVSRFTSIRKVNPQVPIEKLRRLTEYFDNPLKEVKLDPSFEYTNEENSNVVIKPPYANKNNVAIFKDLQKFQSVGLVKPVGEEYMYWAAMNSKSCMLTALGRQYWRLANDRLI